VFAAVVLSGLIQMAAGALRLGKFIRLVPHPVIFFFLKFPISLDFSSGQLLLVALVIFKLANCIDGCLLTWLQLVYELPDLGVVAFRELEQNCTGF